MYKSWTDNVALYIYKMNVCRYNVGTVITILLIITPPSLGTCNIKYCNYPLRFHVYDKATADGASLKDWRV